MSYYDAYSKPLELLRRKHNYTQTYVANMIGISPASVSNHENGRTMPDLMTIAAYCKLYNISLAYLYQLVEYYQGSFDVSQSVIDIRNDVALGMVMGI